RLSHVHPEPVYDDFARQPLLPRQWSTQGPSVAWVDFDGDGQAECLMGCGRGGRLGAFTFLPGGIPKKLESSWAAPDDVLAFTASVTTAGRPCVIAAVSGYASEGASRGGCVQITWDGGAAPLSVEPLAGATLETLGGNPGVIAAGDGDGDGDLDLFVGGGVVPGKYPLATPSRLLRREGAGYVVDQPGTELLASTGLVSAAVWVDLEADGFAELVVVGEWGAPRILRNQRGAWSGWDPVVEGWPGSTGKAPLSRRTGWWTSVTAADWDADGRLDLALGNWGLNTGYVAHEAAPLRLYHGALGASGSYDLIESYVDHRTKREVPQRSLNALGRAFPQLMGRFPNHRTYGEASLAELLSVLPSPPARVEATTLESVILWNRADGWHATALPPEVQWAPVYGLVAGDVDGDGHQDLFVGQGFYGMRQEWPRSDAGRGWWLRGDGHGGFEVMTGAASGVVLLGEQRGAALGDADRDGVPDLVVAQNGTATALYKNRRAAGPGTRRVELLGPAGNPTGYGASVRTGTGGVWGARRELRASGGYRSVDEPAWWVAPSEAATELWVLWPGGREQRISLPREGRRIRVTAAGEVHVVAP
ncbi:MAG: VCBS repeat-containing protein, partial [Verrucomicrobiales bacterium]|nr:VCBS repeat-containing protein [Verrucomicrobiales bacterium]